MKAKPCPQCDSIEIGFTAVIDNHFNRVVRYCKRCQNTGAWGYNSTEATVLWNEPKKVVDREKQILPVKFELNNEKKRTLITTIEQLLSGMDKNWKKTEEGRHAIIEAKVILENLRSEIELENNLNSTN